MSSSIAKAFNGPFKRAELVLLPQYAASDNFLSAGKWTGTKNHVLSLNGNEKETTTEALYCIVVGTITADKIYLGKHGNFTPKFNEDARKAKVQFTLARPNDPDFGPDYDEAILAFQKLQDDISGTATQQFFLSKEEGHTMRMNYGLFESKGDNIDKDREKETQAYYVGHEFETYWTSAKATSYSCIMPVFDTNDAPINPNLFADKLVGAMCEVTFTLKHYAVNSHKKPDGKWIEASDIFSAQVETVAILKNPPALARSPYKGRLIRKPHHRPQLPTRMEQVNAAEAFVPRLEFKPAISDVTASLPPGHRTEFAPTITALPSIHDPDVIATETPKITTSAVLVTVTGTATPAIVNAVSGRKKTKATIATNDAEDDAQPAKKRKVDT